MKPAALQVVDRRLHLLNQIPQSANKEIFLKLLKL
jgi:hypothetical protein